MSFSTWLFIEASPNTSPHILGLFICAQSALGAQSIRVMTMEWRHPLSSPHYTLGPYNSDLCSTTVSQPFTTLLASFTCWCLVMTIDILFEYLLPQHCLDFAITCTYKTHATLWKCKVNVRFGLSLMMCNFTSTGCGYPLRAPHKLSTWSASQDALLIVGGSKFPW